MPEQRLTFIRFDHFREVKRKKGNTYKIAYDLYQCSCGNQVVKRRSLVESESVQSTFSCGCITKENIRKLNRKGKKSQGRKGRPSPSKGRIRIITESGRIKYVTFEDLKNIHFGFNDSAKAKLG